MLVQNHEVFKQGQGAGPVYLPGRLGGWDVAAFSPETVAAVVWCGGTPGCVPVLTCAGCVLLAFVPEREAATSCVARVSTLCCH